MRVWSSVSGRTAAVLGTFVAVLAGLAVLAPGAGAVLVHVGNGQVAGVTPVKGVSPASIPGSYAKRRGVSPFSTTDNLNYHSGAVLHGEEPYLIFWDPGSQISSLDKALDERFFADGATDSGAATNVYGVDRQFTDTTGFADYNHTWSASHAITDTQAYPTTGQCTENGGFTETACLFDGQIQAEVARLITADSLPTGIGGNAPIYFVVTPPTVNSCFSDNSTCADNFFCAYHSNFTDSSSTVLYADMATILDANNPKSCQFDGNAAVEEPNGRPIADVMIKAMSHEYNETITDPVNGGGWYNTSSGQEDGDQCNFFGSYNPAHDSNPNAFTPTLGGSAGTLFNQVMNGNDYYTQSEWSNGDGNCEMRPTTSAISAAFTAPTVVSTGQSASLDPSTSSSAGGYSSTTWSFGDGTTSFSRSAPTTTTHAFSTPGTYQVSLTLVDPFGNLSTASHVVSVHAAPAAAFSVAPAHLTAGSATSFNGSGSSEPGGSIATYSWSFGDGSSGTGVAPTHTYTHAGTYTVTLTVTDGFGSTAATSQSVVVSGVPTAKIAVQTAHPVVGGTTKFSGASSTDTGSTITSYSWKFGDGGTGSGASVNHKYTKSGSFTVTLTVTDASGATSTATKSVTVKKIVGIASVTIKTGKKVERVKFVLTGAGTLKIGSKKFKIKHAGSFTFKYKLTKSQLNKLHSHHSVTIKLTAKFTPKGGKTASKHITIKVKG
jgi:PKD repeat protein